MFNIIKTRKYFFIFSIILTIIGAISLFTHGFNFDIDFTGGTEIRAEIGKEFDNDTVAGLVKDIVGEEPSVMKATNHLTGENTDVVIKTKELNFEERTAIYEALRDYYSVNITDGTMLTVNFGKDFKEDELTKYIKDKMNKEPIKIGKYEQTGFIKMPTLTASEVSTLKTAISDKYKVDNNDTNFTSSDFRPGVSSDNISASVGNDLKKSAIWASIIAVLLMMIYIAFRFEFLSAIAAIIALLHDVMVLISVYTIFQIPINLTFVAAVLTVLGYSNNDTIVIFDRIRENLKSMKKVTIAEVVNASVWQTMRRSLLTGATTLIMIILLYVLGVPSIREFAFPLMIGIAFGIYSSVFIAAQLWTVFVDGENKKA